MQRNEFQTILNEALDFFDYANRMNDHKIALYWSEFGKEYAEDLEEAFTLCKKIDPNRFPSVARLQEVLPEARSKNIATRQAVKRQVAVGTTCNACQGTGWVSVPRMCEGYDHPIEFAIACRCEQGDTVRQVLIKNGKEWKLTDQEWGRITNRRVLEEAEAHSTTQTTPGDQERVPTQNYEEVL